MKAAPLSRRDRLRLGRDGVIVFASPACRLLSTSVERLHGKQLTSLANKDDAARIRRDISSFAGEAVYDRPHTMKLRLRDANDVEVVDPLMVNDHAQVVRSIVAAKNAAGSAVARAPSGDP